MSSWFDSVTEGIGGLRAQLRMITLLEHRTMIASDCPTRLLFWICLLLILRQATVQPHSDVIEA